MPDSPQLVGPRTQADMNDPDLRDLNSMLTGLACDDPSLARQEFAKDADINHILTHYGIDGLQLSASRPSFGDYDYNIDLQTALHAVRDVKAAWAHLPPHVRAKYPDYAALMKAVHAGETIDFEPPKADPPPPTPPPA